METIARWSSWLAIAGGALMVFLIAITTYDPTSPAWNAFFLVVLLFGAAVLGFESHTRAATGNLGRWSAWLSNYDTYNPATDPLNPFWIVTTAAFLLGNLGFAVALIRAKAISSIGAWLVLAGAIVGLMVTAGLNIPNLFFAAFGIGWIVVGYQALRPPPAAGG